MELEKAIEKCKSIVKVHNDFMKDTEVENISAEEIEAVETVKKELEKKDKMIELMLEEMTDCEFEMNCSNCNCECERDYDQLYSCNREYFEKKAGESE